MKHQGFWATWSQLVDLTDPRGEINAYRVYRKKKESNTYTNIKLFIDIYKI